MAQTVDLSCGDRKYCNLCRYLLIVTELSDRSTRNSRIERLWVEVGSQFVRHWQAFFSRLERLHGLDIERVGHLWLLQDLFLNAINDDCKTFQDEWNLHPIAGPSTNNKSPQVGAIQF